VDDSRGDQPGVRAPTIMIAERAARLMREAVAR
jgi:hypothetical protein